jgi:hypothetical protein
MQPVRSASLVSHSGAPSVAIQSIEVRAEVSASGIALFRYVLRGDIPRLRLPAAATPERANDLWKHSCVEAFIRPDEAAGYYELNFSPSGQWAVYRFTAYREGMSSPDIETPPEISVRRFTDRLEVDAAVRLRELTGLQGTRRLRVGLATVVEDDNGRLSYWALRHAPGKADFHCPDGFAVELQGIA